MTKIEYRTNFKDYLVFASANLDGLFSAFTVKHLFDNSIQGVEGWDMNVKTLFIPEGEKITPEDMLEDIDEWLASKSDSMANGKTVVVVGNVIKLDQEPGYELFRIMKKLKSRGVSFTWFSNNFDESSIDSLKNIDGKRVSEKLVSNSHLVWNWFSDADLNSYVKAVDDAIDNETAFDDDYKRKLRSFGKMIECFDYSAINDSKSELVKELEGLFNAKAFPESFDFRDGEAIGNWSSEFFRKIKKSVYRLKFAGLECLVLNAQNKDMSFFKDIFAPEELADIDMFIIWSYDGLNYSYKLASNSDDFKLIDIGKICREKLNGDGTKSEGYGVLTELIKDEYSASQKEEA